jgi:two-component system nitrogen regulation sensor histidine kinase NtrY
VRLSHRVTLAASIGAAIAIAGTLLALRLADGELGTAVVLAVLFAIPGVIWSARTVASRIDELHAVLGNAMRAFRDGDFGLRVAVRGDQELAELKRLYNEIADAVRTGRAELHEKEVLLDTILQRTPVAVALLDGAERVIYSNATARELLAAGGRLNGRLLEELDVDASAREALRDAQDALFSIGDETFHLIQRVFHVNARRHRLLLIERLTPELRRQEIGVWKSAIRVINHEINNSIAPISSLVHSARRAQEMPEHRHRLDEIYGLIEERLTFLRGFLDAYAEFARMPAPHKEKTSWNDVLGPVRALYPFEVEGTPALQCAMDRAQMQQVLINLVKNAHESGGPAEEVRVSLRRAGSDCVLQVLDRGAGMSEEVMRQALVPFYSTKAGGSGVGLALCNDVIEAHGGHMRLEARDGGGTAVTCWVPLG